jgi:hypothetical protein
LCVGFGAGIGRSLVDFGIHKILIYLAIIMLNKLVFKFC